MSPCHTPSWQRSPWYFHVGHHQLSKLGGHLREPGFCRRVFFHRAGAGVLQASPVHASPAWPKGGQLGDRWEEKPNMNTTLFPHKKYPSLRVVIWCLRGFTRTRSTCLTWWWGFLWDHLVLGGHNRSGRGRASTTGRGRLPRLQRLNHAHGFVQLLLKFSNLRILEGMGLIVKYIADLGTNMLNFGNQCHITKLKATSSFPKHRPC